MSGICQGRIVVVTGAGRGIGRGHALEFAHQGAKVVVNDLGGDVDGSGSSAGPAEEVAAEIRASGGEAVANTDDVASWDGAQRLIDAAIQTYGGVDVVVNNAGILRDKMLFNLTEDDWDAVIRVHLKATFCTTRHAAVYWRNRNKQGEPVDARVINTTSGVGLYGNQGQTNYAAAKAGIAGFTITAALELEKYGVTVNAINPGGRTRMTVRIGSGEQDKRFDPMSPDNVAPAVVWLGSTQSRGITGRVFDSFGGRIGIAEGWRIGPAVHKNHRWDPAEVGPVIDRLVKEATPPTQMAVISDILRRLEESAPRGDGEPQLEWIGVP